MNRYHSPVVREVDDFRNCDNEPLIRYAISEKLQDDIDFYHHIRPRQTLNPMNPIKYLTILKAA